MKTTVPVRRGRTSGCRCLCGGTAQCGRPSEAHCDACNKKLCTSCTASVETPIGTVLLCEPCGRRMARQMGRVFGGTVFPRHPVTPYQGPRRRTQNTRA